MRAESKIIAETVPEKGAAAESVAVRGAATAGHALVQQQQQTDDREKQPCALAEAAVSRTGRSSSSRTCALVGEKEQHGGAGEIQEDPQAPRTQDCGGRFRQHQIAVGGTAEAHARELKDDARELKETCARSRKMRGSSTRTRPSLRRTCREVPSTPVSNRGERGS